MPTNDPPGLKRLPPAVEGTYMWRIHTTKNRTRQVPIKVAWQAIRVDRQTWQWTPVRFVIESGKSGLSLKQLQSVPWKTAIASTDPDNAEDGAFSEPFKVLGAPPFEMVIVPMTPPRSLPPLPPVHPLAMARVSLEAIRTELGTRAYNALRRRGIATIDAAMMMEDSDFLDFSGVGEKTVAHIREVLDRYRVVEDAP